LRKTLRIAASPKMSDVLLCADDERRPDLGQVGGARITMKGPPVAGGRLGDALPPQAGHLLVMQRVEHEDALALVVHALAHQDVHEDVERLAVVHQRQLIGLGVTVVVSHGDEQDAYGGLLPPEPAKIAGSCDLPRPALSGEPPLLAQEPFEVRSGRGHAARARWPAGVHQEFLSGGDRRNQ
jgi:hypothetical protein